MDVENVECLVVSNPNPKGFIICRKEYPLLFKKATTDGPAVRALTLSHGSFIRAFRVSILDLQLADFVLFYDLLLHF